MCVVSFVKRIKKELATLAYVRTYVSTVCVCVCVCVCV